jgi:hypothetical protein
MYVLFVSKEGSWVSISAQCCNVVEVVMIHEMNKANMATNKKLKETKRKKHPSILFTTQQKPKFSFSKTFANFLSKK